MLKSLSRQVELSATVASLSSRAHFYGSKGGAFIDCIGSSGQCGEDLSMEWWMWTAFLGSQFRVCVCFFFLLKFLWTMSTEVWRALPSVHVERYLQAGYWPSNTALDFLASTSCWTMLLSSLLKHLGTRPWLSTRFLQIFPTHSKRLIQSYSAFLAGTPGVPCVNLKAMKPSAFAPWQTTRGWQNWATHSRLCRLLLAHQAETTWNTFLHSNTFFLDRDLSFLKSCNDIAMYCWFSWPNLVEFLATLFAASTDLPWTKSPLCFGQGDGFGFFEERRAICDHTGHCVSISFFPVFAGLSGFWDELALLWWVDQYDNIKRDLYVEARPDGHLNFTGNVVWLPRGPGVITTVRPQCTSHFSHFFADLFLLVLGCIEIPNGNALNQNL